MLIQIPVVAYNSLVQERQHETWDLVELTALSSGKVVRGMLATSSVLAIFMTALLLPYMAIAWQLRGLDIIEAILLVLWVVVMTPSPAA